MSNSDVQIKEMPVKPEARNAQPASLNRKLTYQPHLQPWVNLLSNSHGGEEHFSAGTNVCVYDVEETRRSPTMYPFQNTGWQRTDADSMYRVMRRYRRVLITTASLGDFTHTIPHRELLTTRRGKPKDQRYDIGEVCFTTRSYTVMFNRQPFEVPVATGVLIGATSSRTGGVSRATHPLDISKTVYVVRALMRLEDWVYVPCRTPFPATSLRALTNSEVTLNNAKKLRPTQLVSATAVTNLPVSFAELTSVAELFAD